MKKMSSPTEGRVQRAFSFPTCKRLSSAAIVLFAAMSLGSLQAAVFNVKTGFGAKGDGTSNDTAAVNNAITAANSAGGGIVEFPAGKYLCGSIHLKSNVTLQLDTATILGASSGYDSPESIGCTAYQDYGHSHFHNALIWGENLTDIGITGTGTIDGNGHFNTGDSSPDKAISLKLCDGVIISGITIKNGGHFGLITNGTNNMMVDNVKILESTERDSFNLINAKHVFVTNSDIEGSDDSMCLKADYALCQKVENLDIHVDNCKILSTGNNAIQFGSESVGDWTDCTFTHCTITKAGKAGLGITSNDGSIIDGVTFSDITLTGCVTPIWLKITNNHRAPNSPPPGKIRNVSFINITGSGNGSTTSTVEGCGTVSPAITIDNIVFNNVKLTVPGGGTAANASNTPPTDDNWQPRYLGTAPSYGFFLRHVRNISFIGCNVGFSSNDNRPAIKCDNNGGNIKIDGLTFQKGSGRPYDLGFINVAGYQVTNSDTPTISATGSTTATIASPPTFTPYSGIYSGGQSVTLASATSGATIRYTTDDSTPTATTGTLYSGSPIAVNDDTPIRAIASASGQTNSAVNTAIYVINGSGPPAAAAPVFTPGGGTYTSTQSVSMSSSTSGASIRYTLDGSTPSETVGTLYSNTPVSISSTTTLKAIAYATGFTDSTVTIATYTITSPTQTAAPVFSPAAGTYSSPQNVAITSTTSGNTIHYTTDGSTPTSTSGTVYSGPVSISGNTTLKAIASASGFTDSNVTTGAYVINIGSGPILLEAESLSPVGTGATVSISNDANASAGVIEFLNSTAAGQSITFTTPSIPAGTYQLQLRYKPNTSRGQHTVTVDGIQVGGTVDQYSTSQTYVTTTLGNVTLSGSGAHTIVMNVTGKNSAASQFYVTADTFTFTSQTPQAAAPVFSPGAGTYATAQSVTISSTTSGTSIRYTTDGSTPTSTSGTLYSGPVSVNSNTVLKAIAYESGFTDSPVVTAAYTIGGPPPTFNFEAESLTYTPSGATASVQTDTNSSGGKWIELAGNSVGDSISYAIPSIAAGTYQLQMEWKGNNSRGIVQLAVDGTNLGSTLDQYASGQTYPTTTFGTVTFASAGTHTVTLTVTGKNGSSSNYQISSDKFTFVGQ